ncbi:MAG: tetratricopeptide repeat protein [bacterium]
MLRTWTLITSCLFSYVLFSQDFSCSIQANVFLEIHQYDSALSYLKCAPGYEENAELLKNSGDCYFFLEKYNQAINTYIVANEINKDIGSYGLAKCYSRLKDTNNTIKYLEQHLNSIYKHPKSFIRIDPDFYFLTNTREWVNLWKKDYYTESELIIEEIRYLIENKKFFDALYLADKTIESQPETAVLHFLRAQVHQNLNAAKNAVKDLSNALELEKKDEYFFQRAKIYNDQGKTKKAIEDISSAIHLNPINISYYRFRAEIFSYSGMYKEAIQDINVYLLYHKEDAKALYFAAGIYFKSADYLNALKLLNKCITLDPGQKKYYEMRGDTYYETKTYKYCINDYATAIDMDGKNSSLLIKKGKAHLELGEREKACNDWKKAKELKDYYAEEFLWEYCQ